MELDKLFWQLNAELYEVEDGKMAYGWNEQCSQDDWQGWAVCFHNMDFGTCYDADINVSDGISLDDNGAMLYLLQNNSKAVEKLKEWHFNIYDLPKEMYIEKSTL